MSLVRSFVIAALLGAVAATPAAADPISWSKSAMTAAPTYFPSGSTAMVVGVGDSAQPVTTALLETLQASSSFELVSDGRALGRVDELSDDVIVKRAFVRPVKRVAIVRVFPSGGSVKAVVTVYAAQGQVASAFTLAPGKTLVENPTPNEAGDGIARDEMQSVEKATGGGGGDGDITYQRQQLAVATGYGVYSLENVQFYQHGKMISDTPSLYEALDMRDKAGAYRHQQAAHDRWAGRGATMMTLGVVGLTTFGTLALIGGASGTYDPATNMSTPNDETLQWALTAVSTGVLIAGIYVWTHNPAPTNLSSDEAIALVDAHNARKKRASELHFVPSASQSGAGFTLLGSF